MDSKSQLYLSNAPDQPITNTVILEAVERRNKMCSDILLLARVNNIRGGKLEFWTADGWKITCDFGEKYEQDKRITKPSQRKRKN